MHVKTKIKDLTVAQYEYVAANVSVNREFKGNQVRVCAQFELTTGVELHVELEAIELAGLLRGLAAVERRAATAEAALALDTQAEELLDDLTEHYVSGVCEIPDCGCSGGAHP